MFKIKETLKQNPVVTDSVRCAANVGSVWVSGKLATRFNEFTAKLFNIKDPNSVAGFVNGVVGVVIFDTAFQKIYSRLIDKMIGMEKEVKDPKTDAGKMFRKVSKLASMVLPWVVLNDTVLKWVPKPLSWVAGATAVAGGLYAHMRERVGSEGLIEKMTQQSQSSK